MSKRRVVITGLGAVTPLGLTAPDSWRAVREGVCGIGPITQYDASGRRVTLAAEDVLGNVAGGLVILSSHPFAIGDFIESGGVSGTVEEISLNHTKLITPDGLTALLPNKELAASKVTNYTVLGQRRIVWKMTASYGAPTETVKAACYRAVEATEHILPDPAPAVYLTAFGESGIDFTVYCWAAAEDFWGAQFALAENLRAEFAEAGVEIPYNKLDVHIVEDSK